MEALSLPAPETSLRRRASAALHRRPLLRGGLLLTPPSLWLVAVYLGALAVLFVSAFWTVDDFTGKLVHHWTLDNFHTLLDEPAYRRIAVRTIVLAGLVTLTDAVVALPFAYYAARVASRRTSQLLFVAVLLPLWSSYLVRVYAWRLILAKHGALNWTLDHIGLGSVGVAYSKTAMWIVFSYVWLPFMIMPVWAAVERVPESLLEASSDMGARGWQTFRRVTLPLVLPGLAAGSIFTFSLTLGDFITPTLVGGAGSDFMGNVIERSVGVANDVPFAAAFAVVPVMVMAIYLFLARRLGAFEAL